MKPLEKTFLIAGLAAICAAFFCFAGVASALEIAIEPQNAQIAPGNKVKVNIFADIATDLISMGVKVSFDPLVLSVDSASKYEDVANGWLLDADGDPGTTDDQYNSPLIEIGSNSVTMIGGHGPSSAGLDGKVLLGWIVFQAIGPGTSDIGVDLARYHPNDPTETYDNFVSFDGTTATVDEPTNLSTDLGAVYVGDDACEGNINGDGFVNFGDLALLKQNFFTDCSTLAPGELCVGDINGDGFVNFGDLALMKQDFFRADCP